MDAVQLSFELHNSAFLVKVGGELTAGTEREFTGRALPALAGFTGPVVFDLSGLEFVDGHGARALAKALAAVPSRQAGLYQCSPALRRVLAAFGLDLPLASMPTSTTPRPVVGALPPGSPGAVGAPVGSRSPGETVLARVQLARSTTRQSALRSSEVMSRLSVTYAALALNRQYRLPGKSADRGRLLALSTRASDLSRQYRRYAAGEAG